MQKYYFIPGRNSSLSYEELKKVLSISGYKFKVLNNTESFVVVGIDGKAIDIERVFHRLGGYVKFGEILSDKIELSELVTDKKVTFGFSIYSEVKDRDELSDFSKKFSKQLKTELKDMGKKARFIGPKSPQLSSGQITGTKLLEKGFELVVLETKDGKMVYGKTITVQDIEDYTKRDFEKPHIDLKMGVMPPKLARIMLNLAGLKEGAMIWDPFCGSGNILMEGLLLGYDMLGSDIDQKAVKSSKGNIAWLSENYDLAEVNYNVIDLDIKRVDNKTLRQLQQTPIEAIVFEPYMGPHMKRMISKQFADEQLEKVNDLYKSVIEVAENLKTPKIKIVSVFPSYKTREGWVTSRYTDLFSKEWTIVFNPKDKGLHWERSNSIIRRNLIVAQRKI